MYSGDDCIARTDKCYSARTTAESHPSVDDWNERVIFPFEKVNMDKPFAVVLYYGKDNYIGEVLLPFSEIYTIGELDYQDITVRLVVSSDL